jgi:hypothetical protein
MPSTRLLLRFCDLFVKTISIISMSPPVRMTKTSPGRFFAKCAGRTYWVNPMFAAWWPVANTQMSRLCRIENRNGLKAGRDTSSRF